MSANWYMTAKVAFATQANCSNFRPNGIIFCNHSLCKNTNANNQTHQVHMGQSVTWKPSHNMEWNCKGFNEIDWTPIILIHTNQWSSGDSCIFGHKRQSIQNSNLCKIKKHTNINFCQGTRSQRKAPSKPLSTPKLELLAATITACSIKFIKTTLCNAQCTNITKNHMVKFQVRCGADKLFKNPSYV